MNSKSLIIIASLAAIIYWIILIFKLPIFNQVTGYFWHFMYFIDKPVLNYWYLIPILTVIILCLLIVNKYHTNHAIVIIILILTGYMVHMGLGFMDNHGLDGFRLRKLSSGHAEFIKLAATEPGIGNILNNYESMLSANPEVRYCRTKPPGQLLFYAVSQNIAGVLLPAATYQDKVANHLQFLSLFWPLLAFMIIWPLYFLSRKLYDKTTAVYSSVLYLFVPGVMLVILHLDQVLYPLISILSCLLIIKSGENNSPIPALLSGMVLYLIVYVSFSLLIIWPMALALLAVTLYKKSGKSGLIKQVANTTIGTIIGFLAAYALFYYIFDYSALSRFMDAMAYHKQWKLWEPGYNNSIKFGLLNIIEFFCWIGLPLAVIFNYSAIGALRNLIKKRFDNLDWPVIITVGALFILAFFGSTKGEVARLWLFLIPFICIIIGNEIERRFKNKSANILVAIITLQFVTIVLMKQFQDFW